MKELDRLLDQLFYSSKMWLIKKGYIVKIDTELGEYQWTEEGVKWVNSMTPKGEGNHDKE